MINIAQKEKCTGCHACYNICPKECIEMKTDIEGFWYPIVDETRCINCGLCEKVCPIFTEREAAANIETKAYAAFSKNDELRLKSSSGGIFTLISEEIIDQGGVVFGAALSDDCRSVYHICVDNKKDLEKLRGSKYVQSKIGDTFKQAKMFLDDGRKVFFTGTPCQIGALLIYLREDYNNLYTQDLICHGVPSPIVWEKYLRQREQKVDESVEKISFRYKKNGWKNYSVHIKFKKGVEYLKNHNEDLYIKTFLTNLCLRPSCYACTFKGLLRSSDITLADFWGVQNVLPEMDDDKGTSLVMIHSKKGEELFNIIKGKVKYKPVELNDVFPDYNLAAIESAKPSKKREAFFKEIRERGFDEVAAKYTKMSIYRRFRGLASKIKHRVKR